MAIKWKIVKVNKDTGSVEAIYFDDASGVSFGPWNIDLPINNGQYPDEAEIERIISGFVPLNMFERAVALNAAPSTAHVEAMVGVEKAYDPNVFVTVAQPPASDPVSELTPVQVV